MNPVYSEILLHDEPFYLLHQRAIFRPLKKQLVLSDVHLGKAAHFRKKGIAMPAQSHLNDIDRMQYLIRQWQPREVLILGDLFHSGYNREWLWFKSLLQEFSQIDFTLIAGNHDILPESEYKVTNLKKLDLLEESRLIFSHAPLDEPSKLNICGHLHPGLRITGIARQSISLPCFYLSKTHLILPAFGNLTGLYLLEREKSASYYLVTAGTIVKL